MLITEIATNEVNPIPNLLKILRRRAQVRIERIHHRHFDARFSQAAPDEICSEETCASDDQNLHAMASMVRSIPSDKPTRARQPVSRVKRPESATKLRASIGDCGCGGSTLAKGARTPVLKAARSATNVIAFTIV